MPGLLTGKVAVITGASSGIGLASAEAFIAAGARVVLADIDDAGGNAAADRLGPAAVYVHTDVSVDEEVRALVDAAVTHFGALDVMFNNAGAGGATSLADLDQASFDRALRVITGSAVSGHRHAARQFQAQGTGGSIITTSSAAGLQGGWGLAGYGIGKHAVIGVIRYAAAEYGRYGIRSNAICPGIILTPLMAGGIPRARKPEFLAFVGARLADEQPAGRAGQPQDVAGVALFLASDLSRFVNGVALPVDGGASAVTAGDFGSITAQARTDFLA